MTQFDVLVTGAETRQGLAVIRALGSEGVSVMAAGSDKHSIGFYSRFARGHYVYPPPHSDGASFAEALFQVVSKHRIPLVFPTSDSALVCLDAYRGNFEGMTQLAMPDSGILCKALDKSKTLEIARQNGIPIPLSCYPTSLEEGLSFGERAGYPLVVKPRGLLPHQATAARVPFKVNYAADPDDLSRIISPLLATGAQLLLQALCPGHQANVCLLWVKGVPHGTYQYDGEREAPLTGGVTSLYRSVPVDSDLARWSYILLQAMAWDGLAAVEFRVDPHTRRKVLLEVNARVWAAIAGAIRLGMNHPCAYYRYLTGGMSPALPGKYPLGVRTRYLPGDLAGLKHLWTGETTHALRGLPSRSQALWDVVREFWSGARAESFWWKDPRPSFAEIRDIARKFGGAALRAGLKRLLGRRGANGKKM